MQKRAVSNPTRPAGLRPIELLTDRAKRYRAHKNPPPLPKQCGFCANTANIDLDHIDGHEAHDQPFNKMWLCRSCNAAKGNAFARAGIGKRTEQFNPTPRRNPTPTLGQYIHAAMVLRGAAPGDIAGAVDVMHATSPTKRREYTQDIWTLRRQRYGRTGRRPPENEEIPF